MSKYHKENPEVPPELPPARPDDKPLPKFARPEVAEHGVIPRAIKPIERAPKGLKRFKIRCEYNGLYQAKYILAENREQAETHYLKEQGLDKVPKSEPQPVLIVTELPD